MKLIFDWLVVVPQHYNDYGRVEICLDGFWGRIQLYRWDYKDAKVVCRQLGYDGCEFFYCIGCHPSLFPIY